PLLGRQQVRRLSRYDRGNRSALGPDREVLAKKDLHVPAADRLHVEKAVVVDVLDHETDLVAVPREHDARLAGWIDRGDHVAMAIRLDMVGKLSGPGADLVLNRSFESGRAGGFDKTTKEG